MSEQNENIDIIQHLESVDLSQIDRSRKVFSGTVTAQVKKMEVVATKPTEKNPRGGNRLSVTLGLEQRVEGLNENDEKVILEPGHVFFDSISLTPTDKYNPLERLADISLAATGVQATGFRMADYVGAVVTVKCKIEDSDEYGKQTRVSRWIPKKSVGGTSIGAKPNPSSGL
jgi:hypothetical protein